MVAVAVFVDGLVVAKLILKFGDYRKGMEVRRNGSGRFGGFVWMDYVLLAILSCEAEIYTVSISCRI